MTPAEYQTIQDAFAKVREGDPGQREAELAKLESASPQLAQQVRALLRADEQVGDFLSQPLVVRETAEDPAQTVLTSNEKAEEFETPKQIGAYRVLQKIGEGGHGVVVLFLQRCHKHFDSRGMSRL